MQDSFLRKLISTVMMGFAAACLLWVFRNVVAQALYETGPGWRDMFKKSGQEERAR
jgi:hypothetical protein